MVVEVQQCRKLEDLDTGLLTAILLYGTQYSTAQERLQSMQVKLGEQIMADFPKTESMKHHHSLIVASTFFDHFLWKKDKLN